MVVDVEIMELPIGRRPQVGVPLTLDLDRDNDLGRDLRDDINALVVGNMVFRTQRNASERSSQRMLSELR